MRVVPLFALAAVGLALAACQKKADATAAPGAAASVSTTSAAAGPTTLPHRKAGLWKLSISVQGPTPMTQTFQTCLDEAAEAKMSVWSSQMGKGACNSSAVEHQLDGSWKFSGSCDMG